MWKQFMTCVCNIHNSYSQKKYWKNNVKFLKLNDSIDNINSNVNKYPAYTTSVTYLSYDKFEQKFYQVLYFEKTYIYFYR